MRKGKVRYVRPSRGRACGKKVQHPDQAAAQFAARRLLAQGAAKIDVYKCRFCKNWHVGHPRGRN